MSLKWSFSGECIAIMRPNSMEFFSSFQLLSKKYSIFLEFGWIHGKKQRNFRKSIRKSTNFLIFCIYTRDWNSSREHFLLFLRITNFKLFTSWGIRPSTKLPHICTATQWRKIYLTSLRWEKWKKPGENLELNQDLRSSLNLSWLQMKE